MREAEEAMGNERGERTRRHAPSVSGKYTLDDTLRFLKALSGSDDAMSRMWRGLYGDLTAQTDNEGAIHILHEAYDSLITLSNELPVLDCSEFVNDTRMLMDGLDYWEINEFVYANHTGTLMDGIALLTLTGWKMAGPVSYRYGPLDDGLPGVRFGLRFVRGERREA